MKFRNIIVICIVAFLGAVYALFLHQSQESLLMYREQQQVFLLDADYIANLIRQPAGLSTLMAQWMIQYFDTPWAGAAITALLVSLTGYLIWLSINRICHSLICLPLALLPVFLQGVYLTNMGYNYEGLTALFLYSLAFYAYTLITGKTNYLLRLLTGCVLTVWLFIYAGSVANLFALSALVYDVLQKHTRSFSSIAFSAICFIFSAFYVSRGTIPGYDYALWVKGYAQYYIETSAWLNLSWMSILVTLVISWAVRQINIKRHIEMAVSIVIIGAFAFFIYWQTGKKTDKDFRTLAGLMNAINHEDWDSIIASPDLNTANYLHLNCLNLALSHKSKMMTDLFRVPQKSAQSLLASYQAYNDVNVLFSHIYYHTGIISESLCLSFGTMIATPNGNPSMLKLLVKERLILGDYDVAEKYIIRLERTKSYHQWATGMRRFLFNDQAIEEDPELGMKRRSLPIDDHSFVVVDGVMADLLKVISTHPQQTSAWEYALGMLMLDKNMAGIKQLIEMPEFNPEIWNGILPPLVQEAIVTYAENDVDYCTAHGVTSDTIERFQIFRDLALDARRNNRNQQSALAQFRGSFWYYYMFT